MDGYARGIYAALTYAPYNDGDGTVMAIGDALVMRLVEGRPVPSFVNIDNDNNAIQVSYIYSKPTTGYELRQFDADSLLG